MTNPVYVIWNPGAGSAEQNAAVKDELSRVAGVTIEASTSVEHVEELVLQAPQGTRLVVAAGGDGSVNAVINGMMRRPRKIPLGVLPLGTGNDLARTLAIPLDPQLAATLYHPDQLGGARFRDMDVVEITLQTQTRWYANMATGGNSGMVLERLTDDMKQFWGPLSYLRGAVEVLGDLAVFDLTIQLDNLREERFEALNVLLANGRVTGGGLRVDPRASLEDGLLEVIIIRDGTPVDIADLATRYWLSDYFESDLIIHRRASRIVLHSEPAMPFTTDGNLLPEPPREFRVHHRALPVLVGPEYVPSPTLETEVE